MNRNNIIKLVISILLTIIFGYFLIRQISPEEIITIISAVPLKILIIAFLLYVLSYVFRVLRFKVMLKLSFWELFKITCLHNMFNGLLPFRTGELSYIYLVSKNGEKKEKAVSSLVVARFFDFLMIFILFVSMILLSGTKEKNLIISSEIFFAAIILFIVAIITSGFFFKHIKKIASRIEIIMKVVLFAENIVNNLKEIGTIKKSLLIGGISIAIWAANYALIVLIVYAMGITLPIYSMIIAITFSILINTLPIHGLVSFGTMETGWVLSFMLFNVEKGLAISSGFAFHIINIIFFMIMGIVGIIAYAPLLSKLKQKN